MTTAEFAEMYAAWPTLDEWTTTPATARDAVLRWAADNPRLADRLPARDYLKKLDFVTKAHETWPR